MMCLNCGKKIQLGGTGNVTYWYHTTAGDVYCYRRLDEPHARWDMIAIPREPQETPK